MVLLKTININQHTIKLQKGQQSSYRPIYSLSLIKLKMFKTYIKTNLANDFIQFSKSLVRTSIFFIRKPEGSFCIYINHQDLNNLFIKNWCLLPLIGKLLDRLGQAKKFIQLHLISPYD